MLGVAAPAFQAVSAAAAGASHADVPAAGAAASKVGGIPRSTMLGVAVPGIAPTREASEAAQAPGPQKRPAEAPPSGSREAARGASPGAGKHRAPAPTLPLQVSYVPPPAPLEELKAPPPPVVVRRGGLPLTTVALIVGGVVLVGGVAIALLWKGAPPMTAQARTTADGTDALHLACAPKSCPDGTTASLGGAKAVFAAGEADLPLPTPLHLGDNDFALVVDRPGIGRDEMMKFTVPVAYRVRADVTTMSGPKPAITVRVEAKAGTDVKVDGKPVPLDGNGAGAYAVDETAAAEGPADESRVVSLDLPYTVTPPAATKVPAESGTVSARVAISPLRIDSPGAGAVVDEDHVLVAGRGPKAASVTVDGNTVAVGPDGAFETTVPLTALGDHVVEVRGGTPALMPRTIRLSVSRVASLADAARAFEQQHPIGYDVTMADIAGKAGQPIVVEGPVLEARGSGHRTLVLVDDKRGCRAGPCRARVIVGRDLPLSPGDVLRAYGTVARAFTTPAGQTVPEIEAQFALRSAKGRP